MDSYGNIDNKNTITFTVQKQHASAYIWPANSQVELVNISTYYGYNTICNITGKSVDIYQDTCGIKYYYSHHYNTYLPN